MQIMRCDKCGFEIRPKYENSDSAKYQIIKICPRGETKEIDLCFNCSRDFEEFLYGEDYHKDSIHYW